MSKHPDSLLAEAEGPDGATSALPRANKYKAATMPSATSLRDRKLESDIYI